MSAVATEKRSGRSRLDRDTIIEACLELTSRPGVRTLSVRELGQRLGADPTAIYRHFRTKDEVVLAALDHLNAEGVRRVTAVPERWQERLRQLLKHSLELLTAHPAIGMEASSATTHGPGERAAVEMILGAFTRAGLSEDEVVKHYALFAQHLMASAAGIARSAADRGEVGPSGAWFDSTPTADPATHPLLARMATRLGDLQDAELVALGSDVIIASAERTAALAPATGPGA